MQYILLIYEDEKNRAQVSPEEGQAEMAKWFAYTKELSEAGALVAGDALHPVASATTVRHRDGKLLTTDGPFAETKEQLGGYYLIEAADLDEAIKWAAKLPNVGRGSIEVRPIMAFDPPG